MQNKSDRLNVIRKMICLEKAVSFTTSVSSITCSSVTLRRDIGPSLKSSIVVYFCKIRIDVL